VLQFSENMGIDNESIEDVSSAPFLTKKGDEVPDLISDGSIDRSHLQDMGALGNMHVSSIEWDETESNWHIDH
jgi:hypothetical protein